MCAGQRETETTNNDNSILCKYLRQSSRLSPLCDRLGHPHLPMSLINNILFVLFVNMLNQFQNQWMTGLGKENEQNTSLNISNSWQTNLGIGPLGLFQQFGTQQFGTNSMNGLHTSAEQIALLQAHQPMAQLNHFSLLCHSLTLSNRNVIAPQMMGEVNTSNTPEEVLLLTRGSSSSTRTT